MNTSTLRAAAIAGAAFALSACGNMSGLSGSSDYGCKAPLGVRCDSVSGNYYNALQNNLPAQRRVPAVDPTDGMSLRDRLHAPQDLTVATHTRGLPPQAADGFAATPLRSQSTVLRLWIKPWEDADHDLYEESRVYVQVDNGRWLLEHAQRQVRDAYAPIRSPQATARGKPAGGDSPVRVSQQSNGDDGPPLTHALKAMQRTGDSTSDY